MNRGLAAARLIAWGVRKPAPESPTEGIHVNMRIIHLAAVAAVVLTAACATIHTGETVRFKTYVEEPPLRRFADLTTIDSDAEGAIEIALKSVSNESASAG